MELMPGYKQTEVGVIPEDWDVKRLREISPSQSVGLVINPSSYFETNGEVPMLVGSCISENKINAEKASRISSKNSERLSACRLKTGDLVTVRVGFPGTTAVVPTELDGCNCASMMIIRSHKSFDSYWLAQLLNSPIGRAQIENVEYGTAQKQFNISDAIDFIFPVPPPAEQSKIAEAAKSFDEYIESLEQKIDKRRGIKQAAMQELLTGKRRLPGFEGEWEVRRLGDVAPLQRGFDLPNPKLEDGPYPVVYSNGVMNHHAAFQVKGPGVVTGRSGTIGKVRYVANDFWPHNTSLWVTSFRGNDPKFIFYLLSSMGIERFASGSGVPTLNRNDLHDQSIRIPSDTREQIAIATVLSDLDTDLEASNQQLAKASALKQGMMQQLLTGKIRLT